MSKHTPEPWISGDEHSDDRPTLWDDEGCCVAEFNRFMGAKRAIANRDRAMACVNACKGIDPEAVPYLLAACKAALADRFGSDDPCVDLDPITNQLRDAIAKAEGENTNAKA